LTIFGINNITELDKLPQLDKKLFDDNKEVLNKIIDKHMIDLLKLYTVEELSYYDRKRLKNFAYTFFKNLYKQNQINLKTKKVFEKMMENSYSNKTYCCIK